VCFVSPRRCFALSFTLIAKTDFPQIGGIIFTTIVATTVIYELIKAIFNRISLEKAYEINIPIRDVYIPI